MPFLKIDCRESELVRICKYLIENIPHFKDVDFIVESLPIGDVVIRDKEKGEDLVIFERKTLQDLNSSIKDGRYEEQSFRLNGSTVNNHNIIYLIEGDMNNSNIFKQRLDKKMLYSAMFSLNYYKGFSLIRTFTTEETAYFICNTLYKMKKGIQEKKEGFYKNLENKQPDSLSSQPIENEGEHTSENYCHVVKQVKKENITPENIGEIMLSQIPGISSVSAIALMKEFNTIGNMLEILKKNGVGCLQNITYVNEKQQTRKINKTVISNINKYFL